MGTRDQKALGDGVLCLPMIETREGLEKVEEIAATPGLDGLYIGPSDLAISLGLGPGLDRDEPEHVAAVEKSSKPARRTTSFPASTPARRALRSISRRKASAS